MSADAVGLPGMSHVALRHRDAVRHAAVSDRTCRAIRTTPSAFCRSARCTRAARARSRRGVDVHAPALFAAEVAVRLDDMALAGILRVDGKVNVNAPVRRAVVLFKKRERFRGSACSAPRSGFRQSTAHSGSGSPSSPPLRPPRRSPRGKKVHIGKSSSCRPRSSRSGQGLAAAISSRTSLSSIGENGLEEPVLQRQSAADAAHQRHGAWLWQLMSPGAKGTCSCPFQVLRAFSGFSSPI